MRNSKQTLLAAAIGLLLFFAVNVAGQEIQQGDHVDVTLYDGRAFKNAEVQRLDEQSVVIRNGTHLTIFKRHDVQTISLAGPASPAAPRTTTPQVPATPRQVRSTLLAALVVGLLVVLAYAFWRTQINRELRAEATRLASTDGRGPPDGVR